jgi:sialic acid synthase SpsE
MIDCVAEFGQSNRGDLATAIRQADVAKAAGCTYVKFQAFDPARLAGPTARRYWSESLGGAETQLETFHVNGNLAPEGWRQLGDHCRSIGIGFMCSPFDLESVDLLVDAGVDAIKIASGEITHRQLLQRVAETGLPVVLSTGAATETEIARALGWLSSENVTLLACTLSYPCADEDAELGRVQALEMYGYPVGYSDHTLRTDTALAAVVAGATMLEKHCTLDALGGVPDDRMALEPARLRQYVAYAQLGEKMRGEGYLGTSDAEQAARAGARRSLHAATNIPAGKTAARDIPAGKQIESYDVQF